MPDPEELRAFAARRWDLVADQKLSFVANRYRSGGAEACRRAVRSMAQRWARLHPDGPATVLLGDVSTETLVAALEAQQFELRIQIRSSLRQRV